MKIDSKKVLYFFFIFLLGSFVGWIYEGLFCLYEEGIFYNSGVLYGPWIPIYGIGAICLYFLKPLKKNPVLLFLFSFIITGIVEYLIGFIGREFFGLVLWNYDGLFLNINGLVCFRSLITFSLGGLLFHYLIEPFLEKLYNKANYKYIKLVSVIIFILFIIDIVLSILYRTPRTY